MFLQVAAAVGANEPPDLCKNESDGEAGEVTQWLRALGAPAEAPGLVLRTQMKVHSVCNSSSGGLTPSAVLHGYQALICCFCM